MPYFTGSTRVLTASGTVNGAAFTTISCDNINTPTGPTGDRLFKGQQAEWSGSGGYPALGFGMSVTGWVRTDVNGDIPCGFSDPGNGLVSFAETMSASSLVFVTMSDGGSASLSGTVDYDGGGSLSVSKPASATWECSCSVSEVIDVYSGPSPWVNNVPDAPAITFARLYEVLTPGAGYSCSASTGSGLSVSGSGTVPNAIIEVVGYDVIAACGGTISYLFVDNGFDTRNNAFSQTFSASAAATGCTAQAPLSGSDPVTGTSFSGAGGPSMTLVGAANDSAGAGTRGTVSVSRGPDKAVSISGTILTAANMPYPDTLTFGIGGIPGTTTATGAGSFSASGTQRNYGAGGEMSYTNGTYGYSPPGVQVETYAPLSASITTTSLAENGEDYTDPTPDPDTGLVDFPRITRLLIHGKPFAGIGLSHAATLAIPGAFPAAAASLTKTYSPEIPADSYPYLRLSVRSIGAGNLPARVTIPPCSEGVAANETDVYSGAGTPTKTWDFKTGADGEYVTVDLPLFAPDNLGAVTDAHDGQYPYPVRKGAHDGIWRIGEITVAITGAAGSNTIEVQSATLVRKGEIAATWLPTWQHSVYKSSVPSLSPEWPAALQLGPDRQISEVETTSYDYARRFLYAHADGQPILEEWDFGYTRTEGGATGVVSYNFISRSIQSLCDAINGNVNQYAPDGTLAGSVRLHPGWTATPGVAIPAAFVPAHGGDLPPADPYYYNAGLPAVYLAAKGQIAMDGGLSVQGVPLYDQVDCYPGGPMLSVECGAVLRGVVQGLLLTAAPEDGSPDRKAAAAGKTVTLTQQEDIPVGGTNETGQVRGTGTSGADGWYSTTNPAGRAGKVSHRATADSDGTDSTASYGGDTWFARRRHYTGFILVPPSVGARSPRGLNTRQGGYYGSVVVTGTPKRGRIQWRRTEGEQVPRTDAWHVTTFVSTPAGTEADGEPWPWYDDRDGSLHVFYTRATFDSAVYEEGEEPTTTAVREAVSFDDGATWAESVTASDGARHGQAVIGAGANGGCLRAWFRPNAGYPDNPDPGVIVGTYQSAGDASPSAPFVFRYLEGLDTGVMVTDDDTFALTYSGDSGDRFRLFVMMGREPEPSGWSSADDGRTWTRDIPRLTPVIGGASAVLSGSDSPISDVILGRDTEET